MRVLRFWLRSELVVKVLRVFAPTAQPARPRRFAGVIHPVWKPPRAVVCAITGRETEDDEKCQGLARGTKERGAEEHERLLPTAAISSNLAQSAKNSQQNLLPNST